MSPRPERERADAGELSQVYCGFGAPDVVMRARPDEDAKSRHSPNWLPVKGCSDLEDGADDSRWRPGSICTQLSELDVPIPIDPVTIDFVMTPQAEI